VPFDSVHEELIYPQYQVGLVAPGFLPMGMSLPQFIIRMRILRYLIDIYYAEYNGENVGLFESRMTDEGDHEIHVCWFTSSRKKRLLTGIEALKMFPGATAYVPKDDANGHFALTRKGYLDYEGEKLDMHLFKVREAA